MPHRGKDYWDWADSALQHESHEEACNDNLQIDIQARVSRLGVTELFMGVYKADGHHLMEEYHRERHGETVAQALAWGAERARRLSNGWPA